MNSFILFEVIIYCAIMLGIGFYFSRKKLNQSDFILGGNKLPGWALAFSERATGESAWLLLGATGFAFATGLSSIWMFLGMAIGIIFSWLFFAKKFMSERKKYNVLTLPDYLAVKFPYHANLIRWTGGLMIVTFFMFYLGAQFAGAGKTLLATFGLNMTTGILLTAVIVITYACLGGFLSVVWSDVIQSILMLATLVIVPIVAFMEISSNNLSVSTALSQAGNGADSWSGGLTGFGLGILLFANFSWFFGYLGGQPQLSSRFMALKNEKDAKTASIVAIIWTFLGLGGAFLIGIAGLTLYGPGSFEDVEMLLPHMLLDLLPFWLAGILLAGILAAIMSTADSQLLVITSSVSEDILHKALGLKLTEKQLVTVSRVSVFIAGILGLIIALTSKSLVYTVVSWAWAGIGNSFSVAIILTFFWKRVSGAGVVAAIVTGFASTIIWISTPLDEMFTSRAATFFIALLAGIIVSLLLPEKKDRMHSGNQDVHTT